ncbi:hypothetical protein FCV25MIE_30844 [Fagus crenata]
MSQSLSVDSAHKSVSNPLARVLAQQLQQENSLYNQKLSVHIKKKGGLGRRARGKASSATLNRISSSFHVGSVIWISLYLAFFVI